MTSTVEGTAAAVGTDPADEAGGEVIYSSDGLAPLDSTKPPMSVASPTAAGAGGDGKQQGSDGAAGAEGAVDSEEAVLDSSGMNVVDAFEVFKGKIYSVKTIETTPGAKHPTAVKETPLQRLARLQAEINELEAELSTTTANTGRDFDEEVVQLATSLKSRLKTVEEASNRLPQQDELTRLIRQQLKQTASVGSQSSAAPGASPTGVVYELYGTAQNPTTTVEDRLTKMERLVGSSAVSTKSLVSRLDDVETMVGRIDPTSVEQAANKAKVIRADLEAASKARNKLTATYKKEDSKTIQELHEQMVELEGLSRYLPALTQRLQQMANLHVQSASFASRLTATEQQASQVQATLGELESTLDAIQTQMVKNLEQVEQNVQKLDERLNKL